MKIAVLTNDNQWFVPYAKDLCAKIDGCELFFAHEDMGDDGFDVVFILSYHRIISEEYLAKNKRNIVIHGSDLPAGKGWAPVFWQILEGQDDIVFTMFEAGAGMDDGDVYMKKSMHLTGYELHDELRKKQAEHTVGMCLEFIENIDAYTPPTPQSGEETVYAKRSAKDAELDLGVTLKEQFNLLRICDNENYPAFFKIDGRKYVLKIEEVENEDR